MSDIYSELMTMKKNGREAVIVTVVEKQGPGPVEVGKKMLASTSGRIFGTIGGGSLELHALKECQEVLECRKSKLSRYLLDEGRLIENALTLPMVCGGSVSLFYEYMGPSAHIYIRCRTCRAGLMSCAKNDELFCDSH